MIVTKYKLAQIVIVWKTESANKVQIMLLLDDTNDNIQLFL